MAFFILPLLSFLLLSATGSHAALPAEDYWHTVLPNTPIPDDIRDLLVPADDESSFHAARTSGAQIHTEETSDSFTAWNKASTVDAQIQSKEIASLFILEKDLVVHGAEMTPLFAKSAPMFSPFLPRRLADSVPFSSEKLPEILDRFSIQPGSSQAETMKETLRVCEEPADNGERKLCATSLESMVDFSTAVLGTCEVRPVSTRVVVGKKDNIGQHTVGGSNGVRRISAGSKFVACHPIGWPYKVYLCHSWPGLRGYTVDMVGADGAVAVEAAAVCHLDTSCWYADNLAFKLLGVKPGTDSVCHFLARGQIVWATTY